MNKPADQKTHSQPKAEPKLNDAAPALPEAAPKQPAAPSLQGDAPGVFAPQPGQSVRVCVCGALNPASAHKCLACGQDISDVMPTDYTGDAPAPVSETPAPIHVTAFGGALYRLTSTDGRASLDISGNCTLGRAAELAEYLADKPYVGRRQAHLTLDGGKLYIVHGGGANPTCLNNAPLREGEPCPLHPGDEIALGGMVINGERQPFAAYFTVSEIDAK